jgi:hypothetical protein
MTTSADGGTTSSPGPLPSPLDSIDDMRATAKWMLLAAGAVGAALISGGPLVAVGKVHGGLHYFFVILGLLLVLAGVGGAIWFASQVLMPRLMTPKMIRDWLTASNTDTDSGPDKDQPTSPGATLQKPASLKAVGRRPKASRTIREWHGLDDLRDLIKAEPEEFFGSAESVDKLFDAQASLGRNAVSLVALAAREKDPEQRARIQAQLQRVTENRVRVDAYVRWLTALTHAWRVRKDLDRSRIATIAGGVLVIIGALFFFIATANGGPAYVPVVTTSPAAVPTAAPTP